MFQCSSIPPLFPQMMSVQLPVTAAPTSSLCIMFPHLRYFLFLSCEGVHSPCLRCSVLCSTRSLLSPHLCHHLSLLPSVLQQLPSSSLSPPFRIVSLHIYIIMPWKICLFACMLTFPFYGDSLLACGTGWSVGWPAVLAAPSFCVSIYSNLSISFPLPT